MRFQITFLTAILIFSSFLTACPSNDQPNTTPNTANANTTTAPKTNADNRFTTTKPTEAATTNDAPTITPVVRAYYDALKKKDDAAFRKVLTQAFIKKLEGDMKAEGVKSTLVAYAAEGEIIDKPIEVRNEKIEGDKAIAEIKGGNYATWIPLEFVKENGEWKYTGESPAVREVKDSAQPSNGAK